MCGCVVRAVIIIIIKLSNEGDKRLPERQAVYRGNL